MQSEFNFEHIEKITNFIRSKTDIKPEIGIILGTALGSLAEEIESPVVIDYKDIPNFMISTVQGHAGKLIFGKIAEKNVVCMSGRFHYYEGYSFEQLVVPVRVFKLLGVETVILTNAAGAINPEYNVGDIMLINDHIKFASTSPLRGPNVPEFGEKRFFDVGDMYTKELRTLAHKCAANIGLTLQEGVYIYFPGPQFESPAEIRAARILGADAVGMSTFTEALTAAHCGIKVLGLSLMTNMAAGVTSAPVINDDFFEVATVNAKKCRALLREVIKNY